MTSTVPVGRGKKLLALVDDEDYALVAPFFWTIKRAPCGVVYAYRQWRDEKQGHGQLMHCLIMGITGIDHINHDGLDNRRANLRAATAAQNQANQRPRVGGSSPYKGVTWHKAHKRWAAQMTVKGEKVRLGNFVDEIDAARAYDAAARELRGEYARLNFPEDV